MKKKLCLLFGLLLAFPLTGCGNKEDVKYNVIIPTIEGCNIETDKQAYAAGELVKVDVELEEKYFLMPNTLKYDDEIIDETNTFIMPERNVNLSAEVLKDNLPKNHIYGARFTGSHAQSNLATVSLPNIPLTNVSALVVEVRFNEQINNLWIRPICTTSSGIVYDSFGIETSSTFNYSCEMDNPSAVAVYPWATVGWGGWIPSWDTRFDPYPPTFYIEVKTENFFSRFTKQGTETSNAGQPLKSSDFIDSLGIHITGDTTKVDFTIGRLYARKNGVLVQLSNPANYLNYKKDGFNYASAAKIDPTGVYQSPLNVETFRCYKEKTDKVLVIGDSIFTRWWINSGVRSIEECINCEAIRDTLGGTTITKIRDGDDSIIDHIEKGVYDKYFELYKGQFKYIVIQRASNDIWNYGSNILTLGEITDATTSTIMGSVKYVLNYFKEKCPKAKIIIGNGNYRHDGINDDYVQTYNSKLKSLIDNMEGINYFDEYTSCGITSLNWELYLNSSSQPHHNGSAPDNLHPNDYGATMITNSWVNFLKTI